MIITILTGGSGSENIQNDFYKINKNLSLNLIINGYDDGKSTGILRNTFKGILGISDFRKNQILEYKIRYGNNKIYNLLNHRFTINHNPHKYIIDLINTTFMDDDYNYDIYNFLIFNTNHYFKIVNNNIIYDDFNFMNIIYCSLLHKNNNNMITVCKIIKKVLKLKNNIFINSNKNLILNAITKNNNRLLDEASIVNFNDNNDKIIDICFNNNIPNLNYKTKKLLLKSDIIICSCGTQFSSLIPTYKTNGFKKTLKKSKACKYLIMNCDYDNDIINYSGDELLDKINEYISLDDFKIIVSNDIHNNLIPTTTKYNCINIAKLINNNKHNGFLLWKYILFDYFKFYYNSHYIFDYDYTIFDDNNMCISLDNIKLLEKINNAIVVSNNCITNLLTIPSNIDTYTNFANIKNNKIINDAFILNDNDVSFIYNIISKLDCCCCLKITNRKNISIAIKPIINRDLFINLFDSYLCDTDLKIIKTGKTTIEILKKGLSKRNLFIDNNYFNNKYTYITDINDIDYNYETDKNLYLQVSNINTTNLFLNSIILNQKYDFCIIVAGINTRFNNNFPKCLININDNKTVLEDIIDKILPFANKIFICCNNYYKDYFLKFDKNHNNIKFVYYNSVDNLQNYPKGNGETIYQLLNNEILTDKIFIMWGDIIISNETIISEMYNLQFDNDFLIPAIYEKTPYAYLITNDNNTVNDIKYYQYEPIDYGFHDQSIFLCNTCILKDNLILKDNTENFFLDIIKQLNNVKYYETKYPIYGYNTIDEFNLIIDKFI